LTDGHVNGKLSNTYGTRSCVAHGKFASNLKNRAGNTNESLTDSTRSCGARFADFSAPSFRLLAVKFFIDFNYM